VATNADLTVNPDAGESLVLAIDIGTSYLKLVVYDSQLEVVQASRIPTRQVAPSPEGELDALTLWQATQHQIIEVGAEVDLQRVAAIGIAGMAESGCLIDANDQPITPMLLWHDRRGIGQAAALRRKAGDDFARLTGLRTTSVRSISKWKWMVDHGAPLEARWCGASEWIALRLTGHWQTDATLAVRTGAFDVLRGEFSAELLELAGASSGLFPPVHGSPADLGSILPGNARDLGLPASTRVVIAGHDDIVAAYGAGGGLGDLIDSGGTAEGLVRIVDSPPKPSETVKARMAMTQYYLPGTWALIAGAGSTGALMDQVSHMLGMDLAELDALAAPPGAYSTGTIEVRLTKESLPQVKISPGAGAPEVWSAVLDLVCDRFADTARRLQRIAGPPTRLVLIGGAARSGELVRRKSERLGMPAVVLAEIDATTRGAAALVALPAKWGSTLDRLAQVF
jgi:sugar (pentulose or hexulose) kinase